MPHYDFFRGPLVASYTISAMVFNSTPDPIVLSNTASMLTVNAIGILWPIPWSATRAYPSSSAK